MRNAIPWIAYLALAPFCAFCADFVLLPDAGHIDVRQRYGAVGDGRADDSAAIQKALDELPARGTLFFPAGTYRISRPLKMSGGIVQGQNRETTIFKLDERCTAFGDPKSPTPVLEAGTENSAAIYLFNLTFDCGSENPGAIGIQFRAKGGAIEDLAVRSGAGKAGIDFSRATPGACLLKHVSIDGFDVGIRAARGQQSLTIEDLALSRQGSAGIFSQGNTLAIRQLVSKNAGPALECPAGGGEITILDSEFSGGSAGACAIVCGEKLLSARNVSSSGYPSVLKHMGEILDRINLAEYLGREVDIAPSVATGSPLDRDAEELPVVAWGRLTDWVSVKDFEANAATGDWTAAIQAAIDSGKSSIYFPAGADYVIKDTIRVRGKVRRIFGMMSTLRGDPQIFADKPMLRIDGEGQGLVALERIAIVSADSEKPVLSIELATPRTVILRHAMLSLITNTPACGPLFMENVECRFRLNHPQKVWARGLATEPLGVRNSSAQFWILGLSAK